MAGLTVGSIYDVNIGKKPERRIISVISAIMFYTYRKIENLYFLSVTMPFFP